VNARRIAEELERCVVVAPGFVGRGPGGATSLLGRGGSDYTALFLAARLGARRCVLFKDVDGLYTADPARDRAALRYEAVTWRTAARVGGRVVQEKAVLYAEFERLAFEITAPGSGVSTRVGLGPDLVAESEAALAAEACA
jgi:aspartokinase